MQQTDTIVWAGRVGIRIASSTGNAVFRQATFAANFALSLVLASSGQACPLCYAPSLTLSEQVTREDAAVVAEWISADVENDNKPATTTFRVREQLQGSHTAVGELIEVHEYRTANLGDLFLVTGGAIGEQAGASPVDSSDERAEGNNAEAVWRWSAPIEVSSAAAEYVKNLPPLTATPIERLVFALPYLEHADDTISNDAYAEFAIAPFEEVAAIADQFPKTDVREWVRSPQTLPTRVGLYGLMLGLCGDTADTSLLEQRIFVSAESFRLGIDGLMGGYLLLNGAAGLDRIDDMKLANPDSSISESLAAMNSVRFLWTDGRAYLNQHVPPEATPITKERIRESMRLVLNRPDLVEHAITDLARWSDWSQIGPIYELYDRPDYDFPSVERSIVRFLLAATRTKTHPPTREQREQAENYLDKLREANPALIKRAERHFFLATQAQ